MQARIIERNFFFGLLLATFVFNFFIFKPFWMVLVLGISFSIILYPLFLRLKALPMKRWLASGLTVLLFILILCGPLFGIGILVFNQSQDLYHSIITEGNLDPSIESIGDQINTILPESLAIDMKEKVSDFFLFISQNVAKIFSTTVSAIFSLFLMFLSMFYFLKDGPRWKRAIVDLSPLDDKDDHKIIRNLSKAVNGVIKGYLFIALIQGVLMGIGLWVFGVPNSALWGVVAGISALVPMIGTATVAVPVVIYLFITKGLIFAIGFTVWAVVLVGLVDNLLNPIVVGSKIDIPPLLVLFAVLGGIALLGPVGILVGPLAMSLLYGLISIYKTEFR